MINHEHKFLFIHIPRTSGTSIQKQFQNKETKDKHWTIHNWKEHLDQQTFNNYYKFTFIRNPWDIIISKYFDKGWYSSPIKGRGGEIGYYSGKNLKHFLTHYQPAKHEHGDSILDYINPKQMDYIGRYENRKKDLEHIAKQIGIPLNPQIHEKSHPDKEHYTKYYNHETREIVAKRYAQDIDYFGYKFGE